MFVPNYVHNTPLNSEHVDDYVEDPDSITRISKLDVSYPLHLHPNDSSALTVVSIKLKGTENYQVWSCAMLLALEGKNKTDFINGSCKRSNTYKVLGRQWDRVNAVVLGWILNSISEELFLGQIFSKRAKHVWEELKETYDKVDGSIMFGLHNQINTLKQNGSSIADYYHKCFKIIGYPTDFGKKKSGQNFKKQNVSNNNSVAKSSSSDFSNEQMATLLSLIKDNKIEKNVQANMAGANQHMSYTDKGLDNVFDISHLQIKVGHPNRTEAFISKIGNLKLSNGLTLYDVMVIPEYRVTLISVHKMAKENKIFVVFDENKCYFVNQDLNLKNVLGTGDQCEGLYYYNEQELVMNVLNKSLNLDKSDKGGDSFEDVSVSSSSFESGGISVTADFLINFGNDADSSDKNFATKNEEGFGQKEGIDYEETFSPVVKMVTVRCLLNIVVSQPWLIFQLDVNNAFLYGDLDEVVYMRPLEGYFPSDNRVCKLKKSLYGLKQVPRQWNAKLTSTLTENGFSQGKSDYSLFTKTNKGVFLALLVYVDDIIITGNNVAKIKKFKVFLKSKFTIKDLRKLKYFLRIEVVDTEKGICLNQRKYVLNLLSEYGMLACKPVDTLLLSKLVISNEATKSDHVLENITNYQKLMGLGIHFVKNSGMFLSAFSNADWAKCIITRKSVTDLKIENLLSVDLHCDSNSAIKIAVNPVDSANQIASVFTKGLGTIQHKNFLEKLGMYDIYQVEMKGGC
ncbi:ribonuclease H-like domain-containing protein [Tanacetum coccineum]